LVRRRPLVVAAFVVVPAVFIALIAFGLVKTKAPKAVVGSRAPGFSLLALDGRTRITSDSLRGAPVVVNFWASWCVTCPVETADLEAMWKEYGPRGVKFLGVTYGDDVDAARSFVERYGLTYPTVHDPDRDLAEGFGVQGVPETFFIDADGRFAGSESGEQVGSQNGTVVRGPISAPVLRAHIEALLAKSTKATGGAKPPVG
jgi:cytochrome c biogenesis protein CcmG/thiol:disulfide interchange protein DsbE